MKIIKKETSKIIIDLPYSANYLIVKMANLWQQNIKRKKSGKDGTCIVEWRHNDINRKKFIWKEKRKQQRNPSN